MDKFKYFPKWWRTILICVVSLGLCAGVANAATKDKKPVTQRGSFLIKFKARTSNAKVKEVAKYYGASKTLSLSRSESKSRKNLVRWKKLEFKAVKDVKDIARRIVQDNRVDKIDKVYFRTNRR